MGSLKSALLRLLLPAGAIIGSALLQLALVSVWPGIQHRYIANVSLDSYLAVVAMLILSFWVGRVLWTRAPERSTLLLSLVAPLGWFLALLWAVYHPRQLSLSALGFVLLFTALAPLLGLLLAYSLPSNQPLERP
jgi:CDP-diglyceride synthetase